MLASFFPWFLYLIAWVCTYFAVQDGMPLPSTLLHYVVIFNGGVQGLWAAIGHLIFPQQTAKKIGWQSNGFQTEIGFTNLGIGVAGVLSYFHIGWSEGLAVFIIVYYGGCAYNHVKERIMFKNNAPCNSGPMLYSTIVTVVTLIICIK